MATQVIDGRKRSRLGTALVAFAIALVVLALASQAGSIWSSRGEPRVQPVVQVSLTPQTFANVGHIPPGCRPKYGCPEGTNGARP